MAPLEIVAAGGLTLAVLALIFMATRQSQSTGPLIPAALAIGFGSFTLVTAAREGAETLWHNQTTSLWGLQLWLDLLFCALIAFWLIVPRARRQGMNMLPWTLFVIATLSIGLLVMVARLVWLERRTQS